MIAELPPCDWCSVAPSGQGGRFCGRKCRQWAFRVRSLARRPWTAARPPKRLAYADPPYVGLSAKYYRDQPTFAGEVDHAALIASLKAYDGWALSCSSKSLRFLLPLCPPEVRVCSWVKHGSVPAATWGLHAHWEGLLVMPARSPRPGMADTLVSHPARHGGTLPGRKPIAFVVWMLECMGAAAGDELEDRFPGTGIVGRVWRELARPPVASFSARVIGDGVALPSRSQTSSRAARARQLSLLEEAR